MNIKENYETKNLVETYTYETCKKPYLFDAIFDSFSQGKQEELLTQFYNLVVKDNGELPLFYEIYLEPTQSEIVEIVDNINDNAYDYCNIDTFITSVIIPYYEKQGGLKRFYHDFKNLKSYEIPTQFTIKAYCSKKYDLVIYKKDTFNRYID